MGTFGNAVGTSVSARSTNTKAVLRAQAPESGTITKLTAKLDGMGPGAGSQAVKAMVYADSGADPNALWAATAEVTVTDGQAAGEVDFLFASGIPIIAGTYYHLGLIMGANTNTIQWYNNGGTGLSHYGNDTYSDGPSDPFGALTESGTNWWIYATYITPPTIAASQVGNDIQVSWS